MTNDFDPGDWITTKEAAELTGYNASYFRTLAGKGRIRARKLGRDWILDKAEVIAYAEEMQRLGHSKHDPWRTGARQRTSDDGGQ
jgi:excisionase family DNA binding protein